MTDVDPRPPSPPTDRTGDAAPGRDAPPQRSRRDTLRPRDDALVARWTATGEIHDPVTGVKSVCFVCAALPDFAFWTAVGPWGMAFLNPITIVLD